MLNVYSDTDKLMNSVDSMLTSKKQKRSLDDDLRTLDVAVKKQGYIFLSLTI